MGKGGRPTKLNEDVQHKICSAIRAGNYIETAAAYAGINKSTLYDWMKRGEREKQRVEKNPRYRVRKREEPFVEFSNAIEKALADAEIRDVAIIARAAEDVWQAAAWRLERKFPDRWGKKMRVEQEVKQEVSGTVVNRHEITEELKQYADAINEVTNYILASQDASQNGVAKPVDTSQTDT